MIASKFILVFITFAITFSIALTFQPSAIRMRVNALQMGGGRSQAEKSSTTRGMFKNLREKFNEASKAPGFYETGDGLAEIELYCKSNKDGTQIGDCPFAQFIQVIPFLFYFRLIDKKFKNIFI